MLAYRLVSSTDGQRFDLPQGRTVVVGRGVDSDLTIYDPTISRRHAELTAGADGVRVKDLDSSNGTHVNGRRLAEALLAPGDTITFGKVSFRLESAPVTPVSPPVAPAVPAGEIIVRQLAARGPSAGDGAAR